MKFEEDFLYESKQEVTNGAPWSLSKCWECIIQHYGLPFVHYCISFIYTIYAHCTALNVTLFLVKIVPTGVYVSNLVRNIYVTSRDRIRLNQIELEDLQLQVQIINTKLSVRDAEFLERAEELRKGIERFHKMRARIRQLIAADEELLHSLDESVPWEDDSGIHASSPPEEREFILQLLKELKYDQDMTSASTEPAEMSCGERAPTEPVPLQEDSVYSSASETDVKQNCHVKIVKVTNVYKVAYLKNFIKHKKIRRATKQAILKKKVDTVKQLLEDWRKTLDMVINRKVSIFNMDPYVEVASQEAMGDYMKQDREFSESDSDIRNFNDNYYEAGLGWPQHSQRNFSSGTEDVTDTSVSVEINKTQYGRYQFDVFDLGENRSHVPNMALAVLPEETVSEMAIEEVRSEASDE